jgi:hypothetical protein
MYRRRLRMAAFLAVVLSGYIYARLLSLCGRLPHDGRRSWRAGDVALDLPHLLEAALAVGWLTGIDKPRRASWLAERRQLLFFLAVFIATPPVWGAINNLPGFGVDLTNVSKWGGEAKASLSLACIVGAGALSAQLYTAYFTLRVRSLYVYVATQTCCVSLYLLAVLVVRTDKLELRMAHMHHLYIGLLLASFAQFNRWHSGVLLAIGMGLFVQGVGAYGFAPLVEPTGCKLVALPVSYASSLTEASGCQLSVALDPSTLLRVQVCPAELPALLFSKAMAC